MRYLRILWTLGIFLTITLAVQPARAQDDPTLETGLKPFGTFHGGNLDHIDLANGSLNLEIPLFSYPQRGGKLQLDFELEYENQGNWLDEVYDDQGFCSYDGWDQLEHGFRIIVKGTPSINQTMTVNDLGGGTIYYDENISLKMPEGPVHQMGPTSVTNWVSTNGSGYQLPTPPNTLNSNPSTEPVIDSNGNGYTAYFNSNSCVLGGPGRPNQYYPPVWFPPALIEDTNGNMITCSSSGWTDTVGRTIPLPVAITSSSDPTDFSKCPDQSTFPVSAAWVWNLPGLDGGTYQLVFCDTSVNEVSEQPTSTGSQCTTGPTSYTSSQLYAVVLPNGTAWRFQYTSDGNGDLAQLSLPIGGSISYTWTTGPLPSGHTSQLTRAVASRTTNDGVTSAPATQYSYSYSMSTNVTTVVTDPLANDSVHNFNSYLFETQAQNYQGSYTAGTLLNTINTGYLPITHPGVGYPIPLPTSVTTVWSNGQQSQVAYTYDSALTYYYPQYSSGGGSFGPSDPDYPGWTYGKQLTKKEYDYGSGSPGSLLRTTNTSYLAFSNPSYLNNNLLNLPSSVQTMDGGGTQRAYTAYSYDGTTPGSSGISTQHDSSPPAGSYRGNLTSVAQWLNTTGGYPTSSKTYFDTGTVNVATDADGNATTYAYSSTYAGAYPTTVTNALSQSTTFAYDLNTGLMTSTTDPNSQTTSTTYDDMLRTSQINYPDTGQTNFSYPSATEVQVSEKIDTTPRYKTSNLIVDGLGRLFQTQLTSDPDGTTYTETQYDGLGRKSKVYNPTRCYAITTNCGESTWGYTTYGYDALNRPMTVTEQDNSAISMSYSGPCTTVTDEAGKVRQSCADGLGRLTSVVEDPSVLNYTTAYTYDTLDNLTGVTEVSSRSRTFAYDSLSRLTSAANPESGTTYYTYDSVGNVITKVDARGTTTCFGTWTGSSCNASVGYDALNRLKQKSYSDSTPTVKYVYDGNSLPSGCSVGSFSYGSYPVGRRTAMCDGAGAEAWSYDKMGRVATDQRTTNSVTRSTTYATPSVPYNYDGTIAQLIYPSGRTISYTPNAAEHMVSAVDTPGSINYATSAEYSPAGGLTSLMNGSSILSTRYYNNRLQPCRIAVNSSGTAPNSCTSSNDGNVLDLSYNFHAGSSDNGNVASITNNITNARSQTFSYDNLNRITSGVTTATHATGPTYCWGELFLYDGQSSTNAGAWGNLTAIGVATTDYNSCYQESLSVGVNSNNQLTATGYGYDYAGNMTSDSSHTYYYDGEGHIVQVDGTSGSCSTATECYVYDGDGKRVEKSPGGTVDKIYWYGTNPDPLDETDGGGTLTEEYIFFNGKRIARRVGP